MAHTASIADTSEKRPARVALDPAARCMNLVLQALAGANGDRVVIRTGQAPAMVVLGQERALARDPLSAYAVRQIAKCLLPTDQLLALADIGATRYTLPPRPELPLERFDVSASETDREMVIEIVRSANVAGMSERVAAGLRVDAEAVRALPDLDAREQVPVGGVKRVHLGVVAA